MELEPTTSEPNLVLAIHGFAQAQEWEPHVESFTANLRKSLSGVRAIKLRLVHLEGQYSADAFVQTQNRGKQLKIAREDRSLSQLLNALQAELNRRGLWQAAA